MKAFLIFSFMIFFSSAVLIFPQTKDITKKELTTISRSDSINIKTVRGVVIDIKSKQPIKDVVVMIVDTANVIRVAQESDSSGVFFITGIMNDKFKVKTSRNGYIGTITGPYNLAAHDTLNMIIKLEAVPKKLREVVVTAKKMNPYLDSVHFYERRDQGLGRFATWMDFKVRGLSNVYDIFRGIPGLIVKNGRVFFARYASSSLGGTEPQPSIYVDGFLANNSDIDWLSAENIEAVEIYNDFYAPAQYSTGRFGGVILIWTKQ